MVTITRTFEVNVTATLESDNKLRNPVAPLIFQEVHLESLTTTELPEARQVAILKKNIVVLIPVAKLGSSINSLIKLINGFLNKFNAQTQNEYKLNQEQTLIFLRNIMWLNSNISKYNWKRQQTSCSCCSKDLPQIDYNTRTSDKVNDFILKVGLRFSASPATITSEWLNFFATNRTYVAKHRLMVSKLLFSGSDNHRTRLSTTDIYNWMLVAHEWNKERGAVKVPEHKLFRDNAILQCLPSDNLWAIISGTVTQSTNFSPEHLEALEGILTKLAPPNIDATINLFHLTRALDGTQTPEAERQFYVGKIARFALLIFRGIVEWSLLQNKLAAKDGRHWLERFPPLHKILALPFSDPNTMRNLNAIITIRSTIAEYFSPLGFFDEHFIVDKIVNAFGEVDKANAFQYSKQEREIFFKELDKLIQAKMEGIWIKLFSEHPRHSNFQRLHEEGALVSPTTMLALISTRIAITPVQRGTPTIEEVDETGIVLDDRKIELPGTANS
jgi:hypothetical protein